MSLIPRCYRYWKKSLSGMNVDVTFLGEALKDALVVPTVAIVTEKGKTGG